MSKRGRVVKPADSTSNTARRSGSTPIAKIDRRLAVLAGKQIRASERTITDWNRRP